MLGRGDSNGRPLTVEVLAQPAGAGVPTTFNLPYSKAIIAGSNVTPIPELRNLIAGTYTFKITDSTGVGASCWRTVTKSITIDTSNYIHTDISLYQQCSGALELTHFGKLLSPAYPYYNIYTGAYHNLLSAELINSSGVTLSYYSGSAVGLPAYTTKVTIPSATISALANGTYTIKTYLNYDGGASINDSCTISTQTWVKAPVVIDLSQSRFIAGCGGDTSAATIIGIGQGGRAPYTWTLYRNVISVDSVIGGPSLSNVFTGLNANVHYILAAADSCGFGSNQNMNVSEALTRSVFSNTGKQCPGDTVTFNVDSLQVASYQWYKDSVAIAGATRYKLQLNNISVAADSGAYYVKILIGGCVVFTKEYNLVVNCAVPLPIHLLDFNAQAIANKVLLSWTTATEKGISGYEIQRSGDGATWRKLAFVNRDINNLQQSSYSYVDAAPINGINYYRLMQVDASGKYDYSPVRVVKFGNAAEGIRIYPNPTTKNVFISGLSGENAIKVTDIMGRLIYMAKTDGKAEFVVDMSSYPAGMYHFSILNVENSIGGFNILKQ